MHWIFTGFDAFDNAESNPSQQAVERLPDEARVQIDGRDSNIPIHKVILPTCCDSAWTAVRVQINQVPTEESFVLILSGLAGKREKISLERFALNVRNYRIPDNRGHQHDDDHIDPGAPDVLRSKLPLRALLTTLNDAGLHAEISDHAGSFVCNETYFLSLQRYAADERCAGVLFVHFPLPNNYAKVEITGDASEKPDAIGEYSRALMLIAQELSLQAAQAERTPTKG